MISDSTIMAINIGLILTNAVIIYAALKVGGDPTLSVIGLIISLSVLLFSMLLKA
jgi:hypothetical protein